MLAQVPQAKIRNNARYYDLLLEPTVTSHETTATINDHEKLSFPNSTFSIGLVTHSYKYGSEVQFVAFSRHAPVLKRRVDKDHGYYRLECGYMEASHETAEKLRNVADMIDQITCYSPVTVYSAPRPKFTAESNLAELLL